MQLRTAARIILWFSLFLLLLNCTSFTFKDLTKQLDEHHQFPTSKTAFLEGLHNRMNIRRSLIEKSCKKNKHFLLEQYSKQLGIEKDWNKISTTIIYSRPEYLLDRKRKIGWCKVPKAGSASMVLTLLKLHNLSQANTKEIWGHTLLAKQMPSATTKDNLNNVTSFIIVRHPFSRILSAFRDKFQNRNRRNQFRKFKKYGLKILKKYRKGSHYQLEKKYQDMPTFEEFIRYIVDTSPLKYNEHWIPYYLSCIPCQIKFNSILHTETLAEDLEHLVEITGIKELRLKHVHHNLAKKDEIQLAISGSTDVDKLYYSTVSKDLLDQLFQIYNIDFEMFGYSIHPYDYYAKDA